MDKINLPEQEVASQSVNNMIATGKFPHALLLTGKNGYGSLNLSVHIAKAILSNQSQTINESKLLSKIDCFSHPDLYIFYPLNKVPDIKSKDPRKNDFLSHWRSFIKDTFYQDYTDWFEHIGLQNKQGIINLLQAKDLMESLQLKPYEANAKVALIWGAEYMNKEAANKLLKLIEEPPDNSYLILMTENKDRLLSTIVSRCQEIPLKPLSNQFIADFLSVHYNMDSIKATQLSEYAEHSLSKAIHLAKETDHQADYEKRFIQWVRFAFMVSKKKSAMDDLMNWSIELSKERKDYQRNFLLFCQQFFRQAYLHNKEINDLVFYQPKETNFSFDKFATFIHDKNYPLIMHHLENSIFELERNVNLKALLTDISFQLTKLLHLKK